jgi:glutaredoxin
VESLSYTKEQGIAEASCSTVEVFTRKGCPHCARARLFLEGLKLDYPEVIVLEYEVNASMSNRDRFLALNTQFNIDKRGVPSFFICNQHIVGFDDEQTTGLNLKSLLKLTAEEAPRTDKEIVSTRFGAVSIEKYGLPLFTVIIGLIDGFNPCAMWVLLLLLSILVNIKDRKRITIIAGTFVFISGAVYFFFMAAWLNLFLIIGFSRALQITVGLIAMVIGTFHINDFVTFKQGVSLSIPDSAKPTIYTHIRNVINAKNMPATFLAIATIAIIVNLIELVCTAGLPAIYTQILTSQHLTTVKYYAYLLLYNLAYIFDDALMVAIVVITLSRKSIQESQGRLLKLMSGSVIFILGIILIFKPDLLM